MQLECGHKRTWDLSRTSKSFWNKFKRFFRKEKRVDGDIPISQPYEWHGLDRYRRSGQESRVQIQEYAQVREVILTDFINVNYYKNIQSLLY